jgi:predicted aspartyl protease
MGLTSVTVRVANPAAPRRQARVVCLVDSGAVYSIIPATTLQRLGLTPHSTRTFTFADGTQITREIGDAVFIMNGRRAASPVIFGEEGDSTLLGTVSIEALGFLLDPIRRELRPLPMILG